MREKFVSALKEIQNKICDEIVSLDTKAQFITDHWKRPDIKLSDGGGGITRTLASGNIFEKAGVNFSEVYGYLSSDFAKKLCIGDHEVPFFATGVSLVIHPYSPCIPTTHANWRYIEAGNFRWYGGGSDLTPYLLYDEDAKHFHQILKNVCDRHGADLYPKFKKWCDEYFFLPHRGEARGIGGIFFDHLGKNEPELIQQYFPFVVELGNAFADQYIPIVKKRMKEHFSDDLRQYQLTRRGRYVEFNLLYDRGTHFGLNTSGRTESILMSLPPLVRWEYCAPECQDPRAKALIEIIKSPREWV